jgi:hypothetical protein
MMNLLPHALLGRLAFAALAAPVALPNPGGWIPADPSSPPVQAEAAVAAQYLSQQFGRQFVVERIDRAETQVVEGSDYRLRLRVAQIDDDLLGARQTCVVTVWSKPWEQSNEVTSYTCTGTVRHQDQD